MTTVHSTYLEKDYLRRGGHRRLATVFRECARLYNAALEHWQTAWRHGDSITLYDQQREFTGVRADDRYWGDMSVEVGRGVLRRLDRARRAFYQRAKAGEKPGYPRFKSGRRWKSVEVAQPTPSMVTNTRGTSVVKVRGLPILRIRPWRPMPPSTQLTGIVITRRPTGVHVALTYKMNLKELKADRADRHPANAPVGIDMGVTDRLALSDGTLIKRRRPDADKVVELQRRIARGKRGSNNRRKLCRQLARLRYREAIGNRNECHRITTDLVRRFGLVALEDLEVKHMTRSAAGTVEKPGSRVAQKRGLNRSILAQTWGVLRWQLEYKSNWYGRKFVLVDPRYTSQTCSGCGAASAGNRNGKRYECGGCGLRMDADTNAAVNIRDRALSATGVGTPPDPWQVTVLDRNAA